MATIDSEQLGMVRVIRLSGAFMTDDAVALIHAALSGCTPPVARCLVVNWSGVESIGSLGIGAIVEAESELSLKGGHYRNCDFSHFMYELRPLLKMGGWKWNYFQTEEEAVRSCLDDPPARRRSPLGPARARRQR